MNLYAYDIAVRTKLKLYFNGMEIYFTAAAEILSPTPLQAAAPAADRIDKMIKFILSLIIN